MASRNIANIYAELSVRDKMSHSLARAQKSIAKFGVSFATMAAKVGSAAAVAGITAYSKYALKAASDLEETLSKSRVVFGAAGADMEAWASTASRAFGQSRQQALDAASTFGNMFAALGIGQGNAAAMSREMTELASDMASFFNTNPDEAIMAIGAALRGESEPIRRFGVNLNDATLKAQAMSMGLYDGKGNLDLNAKALAAYQVILAQSTNAIGDFERTQDGLANSQRTLTALWQDAAAEAGKGLLPVAKDLVSVLSQLDFAAIGGGITSFVADLSKATKGISKFVEATPAWMLGKWSAGPNTGGGVAEAQATAKRLSDMGFAVPGSIAARKQLGIGVEGSAADAAKQIVQDKQRTKRMADLASELKLQQAAQDSRVLSDMQFSLTGVTSGIPGMAGIMDVVEFAKGKHAEMTQKSRMEALNSRTWDEISSGVNSMQARGLGMGAMNVPKEIQDQVTIQREIRDMLKRQLNADNGATF